MKMKHFFYLLIAVLVLSAFSACGGDDPIDTREPTPPKTIDERLIEGAWFGTISASNGIFLEGGGSEFNLYGDNYFYFDEDYFYNNWRGTFGIFISIVPTPIGKHDAYTEDGKLFLTVRGGDFGTDS